MTLLTIAISLFLLMDPIGNVPIYVAVLKNLPPKRQRRIIVRELLIALAVIIFFTFIGEYLLNILGISHSTILIAGGIILFIIALRMIFPTPHMQLDHKEGEEPFIVPLAVPLVAGPSVLAAVMIYSHRATSIQALVGAIIIAWLASTLILISSSFLKRVLGNKGIIACERLMGMILTLLAVQMFMDGIAPVLH